MVKKYMGFHINKKNENFETFCRHFIEHNFLFPRHVNLPFTGRLSAVNYQNLPFTAGKSK